MANTLAPRFRCSECRMVKPKTWHDVADEGGTLICLDCEHALRAPRPWWETDDRYDGVPEEMLAAAR